MNDTEKFQFDLEGYLVIENVLDEVELASLNALVDQRLKEDWDNDPSNDYNKCSPWGQAATDLIDGAMICYDMEFPESARILMVKGAELIIVPTSCDLNEIRTGVLQARAMENMVRIALANYVGEPGKSGQSVAFDGMVFLESGNLRNNQVVRSGESEAAYLANFDLEAMREYRARETWGNAFRKPDKYHWLTSTMVNEPFVRKDARR